MSVKILTDSTSYINDDICHDLDIKKTSLYVTFGEDSIKETAISNQEFYSRMEKEGIPISSQPPAGELLLQMKAVIDAGHDLVAVFLSSDMSGTYETATLIKDVLQDEYPQSKMRVIDSKSNSMQLGFAAIAGAKLAKEGKSFEKVVEAVENNITRSRFLFVPENLDYLKKGGRIGGAGALLGNALKITPVLTVKDAETTIFKTVRTKKKATKVMINKLLADHEAHEVKAIAIHHIDTLEEAKALQTELKNHIDVDTHIANIGPVIGLHVGPGAIGLAYYTKDVLDKE